jgi:hypothetical protein
MTDEIDPTTSEEPGGPMLVAGDDPGSADAYLLLLPDEDPPHPATSASPSPAPSTPPSEVG